MSSDLKVANTEQESKPLLELSTQEVEIEQQGSSSNEAQHESSSEIEEHHLGGEFSSDIMKKMRKDPRAIGKVFKEGKYPYTDRISRRAYENEKKKLQIELLKVQNWVKLTGQKIVVIFEGRDAAGKGGTIKRFMEHLNPRAAKVVALEKPTPHELGQWYFQRYIAHLPTRWCRACNGLLQPN
jgi:polyphosphate kinase 2 (PPK2 family)